MVLLLVPDFLSVRRYQQLLKNTMPLTDTAIRNAKPKEKAVKLSDGGGLFLLIKPNSTKKYWRLAYRFAGKQKLLGFGIYPNVSLTNARDRRDAAKKHLADGVVWG